MGRSQRRKPNRQPETLSFRGGGSGQGLPEGTTTPEKNRPEELVVPLVRVRVDVLPRSTVGEAVVLFGVDERLLARGTNGILGEVPPHYVHPLRRDGFTVGTLDSIELAEPAATIRFRRGG